MAISRVTVWSAGQTLTAAALNAEYDNILTNPIALISPTTGAINFNLQSHVNLPVTALSATSGSTGQVLTYVSAGVIGWSSGSLSTGLNQSVGYKVVGLVGSVSTAQTGSFAFDHATLVSTGKTQSFQVNATSSFTVNVGTAGPVAGGRDQAGNFASTFVHAYAITTGLNSTAPAGILSSVPPPTGPTMPTSYSAWGYLGGFQYSSASTTFPVNQQIRGAWTYYNALQNTGVLSSAPQTEQTLSLTSYFPANALVGKFRLGAQVVGGGALADPAHYRVVSGSDFFTQTMPSNIADTVGWDSVDIPLVSQALIYMSGTSGAANPAITIDVSGWKNPNGGE